MSCMLSEIVKYCPYYILFFVIIFLFFPVFISTPALTGKPPLGGARE